MPTKGRPCGKYVKDKTQVAPRGRSGEPKLGVDRHTRTASSLMKLQVHILVDSVASACAASGYADSVASGWQLQVDMLVDAPQSQYICLYLWMQLQVNTLLPPPSSQNSYWDCHGSFDEQRPFSVEFNFLDFAQIWGILESDKFWEIHCWRVADGKDESW